jgi:hypothetical protein
MVGFQKLIIKYQLPLFFLLAYLLSWWSLPFFRGLLPHGVALAAVIVILLSKDKPGLRAFWKRLTNFRAGWWFLIAILIIIGFKSIDALSSLLTGGTSVSFPRAPIAGVATILFLLGGLWEEPGWSGYALPVLQKRFAKFKHGILIATLILGVFRGIWHLPLVIVGAIPWYDAVWFTPFVFQPFISWLYNKSRGSVPVVMFFHYMSNFLFAISPIFAGADKSQYTTLYLAFGGLATLVLLWKTQFKLGWRGTIENREL